MQHDMIFIRSIGRRWHSPNQGINDDEIDESYHYSVTGLNAIALRCSKLSVVPFLGRRTTNAVLLNQKNM